MLGLGPGGQGSHEHGVRARAEWTQALGQKAGMGAGDRKMSRAPWERKSSSSRGLPGAGRGGGGHSARPT